MDGHPSLRLSLYLRDEGTAAVQREFILGRVTSDGRSEDIVLDCSPGDRTFSCDILFRQRDNRLTVYRMRLNTPSEV